MTALLVDSIAVVHWANAASLRRGSVSDAMRASHPAAPASSSSWSSSARTMAPLDPNVA